DKAGETIKNLLELDIKPRDIMTRKAFENAMVLITVMGGSTNADMHKPQIGIGSVWYEGNTCNMHLNQLAQFVKDSVEKENLKGM
ncbi:dihydroxy-acid dehydratase domain-containing protein, partial [Francisella tularensis]|uniref:dihydroxy-acid dehydratase domain-containing protein n=1 Tax=Francisella tularensis TaxID=263 RepID=UPI003877D940